MCGWLNSARPSRSPKSRQASGRTCVSTSLERPSDRLLGRKDVGTREKHRPKQVLSPKDNSIGIGRLLRRAQLRCPHRLFPCSGSGRGSSSTSLRPTFWRRKWSTVVRRPADPLHPWSNVPSRNREQTIRVEVASPCGESVLLQNVVRSCCKDQQENSSELNSFADRRMSFIRRQEWVEGSWWLSPRASRVGRRPHRDRA